MAAYPAVLVSAGLLLLSHCSEGYTGKSEASIQDGRCVYQGVEIAHNQTAHNVTPCESWTCNVNEGTVHIVGCVTWGAPENCQLEKNVKPHPGCCPKVVCPAGQA